MLEDLSFSVARNDGGKRERERFVRINKRSSKRNRRSFETALYMLCPLRFGFEHSSFQVCKSGGTRGFYGRHGGLAEENGFRLFLFARGRRTRVIKSISRALSACPASRKIAESSFHEVQLPGRSTRGEARRGDASRRNESTEFEECAVTFSSSVSRPSSPSTLSCRATRRRNDVAG